MIQKPIDLLKSSLEELERARDKSTELHEAGKLSDDIHYRHVDNLTPHIETYRYAIQILNKYT